MAKAWGSTGAFQDRQRMARVECICGLYMSAKKIPKFAAFIMRARELGLLIQAIDLDADPVLLSAAAMALGEEEVAGMRYAILHKVQICLMLSDVM